MNRFESGADDLGDVRGRDDADTNQGDAEERDPDAETLGCEQDDEENDEEGDAPEDLHVADDEDAKRNEETPAGLAPVDEGEAENAAEPAADQGEREGHAHRLQEEDGVVPGEEAWDFVDDAIDHQNILARTRNAWRPMSASSALATTVSTTYMPAV